MTHENMYYRMMGNTGIQVSVLSYGFWATYGIKDRLSGEEGVNTAKELMRMVRNSGVNCFDHAEAYGNPNGEAERIFGIALQELQEEDPELWRRSDLVITTKTFWGGPGVNESGLSMKHCREGLDASLSRLQLDYVDLLFCHRPDPHTPTSTVVRSMTQMVRSGRASAWGTSEWSAQQITEAFWIARSEGLEPPQFEQPQYNMLHRDRFENEYFPLFNPPYNIGTTIWSPLRSGFLTGKYLDNIPDDSRATQEGYEWLLEDLEERRRRGEFEVVSKLVDYASKIDCTPAQLALAWCLKNPNVSTILMGATTPAQIEDNMGCIDVAKRLTDEDISELDEILGNKPDSWMGPGGVGTRQLKTI
jgi:voltage-dependent potassium channel beta subunit